MLIERLRDCLECLTINPNENTKKSLFWTRFHAGWPHLLSKFNHAQIHCNCFSCKLLDAHFQIGSCHEVDIQVQAARKSCVLKEVLQIAQNQCPEEICLVARFHPDLSFFLDFDEEAEDMSLQESPVRALLKLCFALSQPGEELAVIEDSIDELIECMQR